MREGACALVCSRLEETTKMLAEPDSRSPSERRATVWAAFAGRWAAAKRQGQPLSNAGGPAYHNIFTRMTPAPPREYVAFVAQHLLQLRHDAQLLADDEYEAHELYSQALTDIAIRWQWFALLRRLHRPDTAYGYLHETLVRRSARRQTEQAEQADFVDFDVWFSDDPQATYPPPARRRPGPPAVSLTPVAAPTRSSGTARMLPMSSLGIEVGPVAEAAVAWWHAYVAHRHARLGATTAAIALVMAIVVPILQRH